MKTGLTLTNAKYDGAYDHKVSFQPTLRNDRTVPAAILDQARWLGTEKKMIPSKTVFLLK